MAEKEARTSNAILKLRNLRKETRSFYEVLVRVRTQQITALGVEIHNLKSRHDNYHGQTFVEEPRKDRISYGPCLLFWPNFA